MVRSKKRKKSKKSKRAKRTRKSAVKKSEKNSFVKQLHKVLSKPNAPVWQNTSNISNSKLKNEMVALDKEVKKMYSSYDKDFIVPKGTPAMVNPYYPLVSHSDSGVKYLRGVKPNTNYFRGFTFPNPSKLKKGDNVFNEMLKLNKDKIGTYNYNPDNAKSLPDLLVSDQGKDVLAFMFNGKNYLKKSDTHDSELASLYQTTYWSSDNAVLTSS